MLSLNIFVIYIFIIFGSINKPEKRKQKNVTKRGSGLWTVALRAPRLAHLALAFNEAALRLARSAAKSSGSS